MTEYISAIADFVMTCLIIYIAYTAGSIRDLLRNDLDDANWLIEKKNSELIKAASWFKAYAVNHRAKGTMESIAKAQVNESRAETLIRAAQEQ